MEATRKTTMPAYDDRVNKILSGLAAGQSRDQLAEDLGYKDYKGLNMYMNRQNYKWDPTRKNYFPANEKSDRQLDEVAKAAEGRVARILSMLKKGMETKEIAKQLRFTDHREMAVYMKEKGYTWNDEEGTYVFTSVQVEEPEQTIQENLSIGSQLLGPSIGLERYLPLLDLLDRHKERLLSTLLSEQLVADQIPRYIVRGVHVTKSVHMAYGLDQLVKEFSQETNVSQKEIFEVALIEFFKKYGYQKEIQTLVGATV
ncbi:hypothetical protein [Brevibacillus panacihumi]|uniref:hypothetical protein n=1 Tax=Brevibacillus panacihumi TaxID=497735 RepID=UPI003D2001D7